MVCKKGKFYQLTAIEKEKVEEKWLKLLKRKSIPECTVTEFWNTFSEKYFPRLKEDACNREDRVLKEKQERNNKRKK